MPDNSEFRQHLADRVSFYRELGIYDFYRRERAASVGLSAETQHAALLPQDLAASGSVNHAGKSGGMAPADGKQEEMTPERALQVIREDIGDCTRCVLHQQGRKQIVFGVGNPRADIMF